MIETDSPSIKTLGEIVNSKSNNFDLVRLIASLSVIYFHSFMIQGVVGEDKVNSFLSPDSTGSIAVYSFFLISGILISKSAEAQKSAVIFTINRVMRIWPGLLFYILVAFTILIPLGSHISIMSLFKIPFINECIYSSILIIQAPCIGVPGLYENNHVTHMFDAPLWSLQVEIYCYCLILIYAVISRYKISNTDNQRRNYSIYVLFILAIFVFFVYNPPSDWHYLPPFIKEGGYSFYPAVFFFVGMILYAYRDLIKIEYKAAIILVFLYLLFPTNKILLYISIVWVVLSIAGSDHLRAWKPAHDYSYGVYIYGFTVQQAVASALPSADGFSNALISMPITLVFAAISWHLVEKPSLSLAKLISGRVRKFQSGFGQAVENGKLESYAEK
jgi:peptidoglycan/LPS O-acetylase OafA/YrhL